MKKPSARRLRRYALPLGVLTLAGATIGTAAMVRPYDVNEHPDTDSIPEPVEAIPTADIDSLRFRELTMDDYTDVAGELGIPVAAIRAVVDIEAGPGGEGFNADNSPIINFDLTMFKMAAKRRGINLNKFKSSHAEVFKNLNKKKYGSTQAAQYARLNAAMGIDTVAALEGTFWGMFQIGGFNWKLCGCDSVQEFVELMSYSEREQLELFARFLTARNLVGYIRNRQWDKFSLRYNGPGYKKHAYDKRMAAAYARFSK